jgi:hypothetical protein
MALMGAGVYLAAVMYQGNLKQLGAAISKDGVPFAESAVALYLVIALTQAGGALGKVSQGLVGIAVIVLVIRLVNGTGQEPLKQFAGGQIGLFTLLMRMAGGQ